MNAKMRCSRAGIRQCACEIAIIYTFLCHICLQASVIAPCALPVGLLQHQHCLESTLYRGTTVVLVPADRLPP